jgi:hypothetical protein
MTRNVEEPTQADLSVGLRLLEVGEEDALSFLGVQAERLEIARQREAAGRSVPAWSTDDAVQKVLSGQRASREDLMRYASKGLAFARDLLARIEPELRSVLCDGTALRPEIASLEKDAREIVKYVASSMVGMLLASLPGALAVAVASIATTLAVIVIKNGVTGFCAVGLRSIEVRV